MATDGPVTPKSGGQFVEQLMARLDRETRALSKITVHEDAATINVFA
jgi:hypothetical protein